MKSKGIKLDLRLARDIAQDYGNRNMRKNGRTEWNNDDWNIASKTLNDLWPVNPILKEWIDKNIS